MSKKTISNIFISDCGNYIAIRVLCLLQPAFDVCRHDGSDLWVCNRDKKGGVDRTRENCPDITKWVLAWLNDGHRKRNGEWVEGFISTLYDFEKGERIDVAFHTPLLSLAPHYEKRRGQ